MAGEMVVINGVRYRIEDAQRRGLLEEKPKREPSAKGRTPKNKAAKPANK